MLTLANWLEIWLQTQPEYRMGYQKVIATLNTGATEAGIVLNSQIFLKTEERPWQLDLDDWESILREARQSRLRVTDVRLIPREPETLKGVRSVTLANEKYRILASRTLRRRQ